MGYIVLAIIFIGLIVLSIKRKKKFIVNYSSLNSQTVEAYKNFILKNKKLNKFRSISIVLGILLVVLTAFLLIYYFYYDRNSYLLLIIFFAFFLISFSIYRPYGKIYKEEIVKKAIKNYDSKLIYTPNEGMSRQDYAFAKFEMFDKYESEDLIQGNILELPFIMSDVHTYREDQDDDRRTYTTLFEGSVARVQLNKNIQSFIYIVDNKLKIFNNDYHMSIDNEAFEKKYDIYSDNQILAMRILTPSVTNSILDLEAKTGIYTEIKIYNDVVYFRFYTGDMFKPIMFDATIEARNLALSIQLLISIKEIMSNILSAMMEVMN